MGSGQWEPLIDSWHYPVLTDREAGAEEMRHKFDWLTIDAFPKTVKNTH